MDIDLVSVGGWAFSVVTALVAYKAATQTHRETTRDGDKTVYVTAITNERAKWREELRRSVAEFSKNAIEPTPCLPELLRLKIDIILRLNPKARDPEEAPKHTFDVELMRSANAIFTALSPGGNRDIWQHLSDLECATQKLLKQEWEVSKEEAVSGRMKTAESATRDADT